jgi:hypothetical protein
MIMEVVHEALVNYAWILSDRLLHLLSSRTERIVIVNAIGYLIRSSKAFHTAHRSVVQIFFPFPRTEGALF